MKKITIVIVTVILIFSGYAEQKTEKPAEPELPNFDILWDYQHPDSTEMKFRALLPEIKKSGDTDYYLQLQTQIARTQGLQRKFEDAHKTLDKIDSLLTAETKTARIRYLLERGRVFRSSGFPEKSGTYFMDAYNYGLENKLDHFTVDAIHMLGIVDPPEKQLDWNLKALEICEKTDDKRTKGWIEPLYNNIGWTYYDLGEYEKSVECFQKCLELNEKSENERYIRIAKWSIAKVYRALNKLDEALGIQLALKKEFEEKQLAQDGYVFEELGEIYLLKEQKEDAKKYFALAFEYLGKDPWLQQNEPERLARLKELSE